MWNEQKQILQSQLAPDERLLWVGQPRSGIVLRATDIFVIPFSLMWGGTAIFIQATALTSDTPILSKLFVLPFVVVGLYLLFGRFILEAKRYLLWDYKRAHHYHLHSFWQTNSVARSASFGCNITEREI